MGESPAPRTVLQAMAEIADVTDRGFTFADERGRERFVCFQDLIAEVRRRAAALQTLALPRGARVALIIPEHQPFIVTFLGALVAGLVPVPIYPPLSLAKVENWLETTAGIMRAAGASAIITVDDVRSLLWSTAARLDAQIVSLDDWQPRAEAPAPVDVALDDLAFLQFTSGSTASPRGVMVTHRNLAANCAGILGELLRSETEVRGISWLPLYHDMGLIGFVLAPLYRAVPVVFLATLGFLKRPALWFELIHRHRSTVTFAPNFAYALAARRVSAEQLANWDLSCVRVAGCGGEPIAPEVLRAFAERFAAAGFRSEALLPCYGMAEATLVVTYSRIGAPWRVDHVDGERLRDEREAVPARTDGDRIAFVGCGAPLADHTIRILDDNGRALPERAVGEVELRGPSVTLGYFADPAASAGAYRDGGLRTGDLGYLAGGELFVTGRKKDLIIVRGRNYAPQTIEWSVGTVPEVRKGNVVAFGRAGQRGTEELVVVCESATADRMALASAIRLRVRDEIGLALDDVVILPSGLLPKTSSGKVQRSRTRSHYLDGTLQRLAASAPAGGAGRLLLLARLRLESIVGRLRYSLRRRRIRIEAGR